MQLDGLSRNRGVVEYGGVDIGVLHLWGSGTSAKQPCDHFGNMDRVVGAANLRTVGAAGACGAACDGDGDGFGLAACTGPIRAGSVTGGPDGADVGLERGCAESCLLKVGAIDKGIENAGHKGSEGLARRKRRRACNVEGREFSGGGRIAQISIKTLDDGVSGALDAC